MLGHDWFTFLGETGLGKSTLMDSLFNTNFESSPSPHSLPSVKLKAHTYELQESNVRLKVKLLNIILLNSYIFYTFKHSSSICEAIFFIIF